MRKNVMVVLLLAALMVFASTPVFAQGSGLPEPFCGNLVEADCDILKMSQDEQLNVSSYVSVVDATTTIAGIPGLPADELVFGWAQDTVLALDPEVTAAMVMLQMQGPEAVMENMEDLMGLTVDFYRTLGLDAVIGFSMPEEIASVIAAESGVDVPSELTLQVIMSDGFAYIATEDLTFIDPSIADMGAWIGVDLAGMVEMGMAQSMEMDDPEAQQAMMTSLGFSAMISSDETRALLAPFVQVTRGDDDEVNGVEVAVFETSFDFAGFLASPGFWSLIRDNLDFINANIDTPISVEDLQQAQMMMTFLGPALLQGLELSSSVGIGLDDYLPYAQVVDFRWDLSGLLAFAASTGALPEGAPERALISLEIDAANADYDDAPEIVAPEDAMIVPLEAMGVE